MSTIEMKSYAELISAVRATMKERSKRLGILRNSGILADPVVNVETEARWAIEILRARPERVLDWFSEEELALYVSMEEV